MTYGTERFSCGQAVEVRRPAGVDAAKRPMFRWESGPTFSHYSRIGELIVAHPDGTTERFPDSQWVRPDDKERS